MENRDIVEKIYDLIKNDLKIPTRAIAYQLAFLFESEHIAAMPKDNWRPISEAPRDASWFLTCCPRMMGLRQIVSYNRVHKHFTKQGGGAIFFHDGDLWQPLPSPPNSDTNGEG